MTLLDLHTTAVELLDVAASGRTGARDQDVQDVHAVHTVAADPAGIVVEADEARVGSSYARCADGNGTLTHLFFSDDEFDIARAKAICAKCGLASLCLSDALDRAEPYGVWGGQLVVEGVVVAVKRGRGRPPKHPRVLIVDEVPIPPHLVA